MVPTDSTVSRGVGGLVSAFGVRVQSLIPYLRKEDCISTYEARC